MYAVIGDGGRQYRVQEGDRVFLDYRETAVGDRLELNQVLLCSGPQGTMIGKPCVEGAVVVAEVLDHAKGPKIKVQKFRRRKKYRRLTGHRQHHTEVRIQEIRCPEESPAPSHQPSEAVSVEP